ncbi:MAG: hypothetical protein QW273_01510 [Candidatus Pacearchaeota archaeon]
MKKERILLLVCLLFLYLLLILSEFSKPSIVGKIKKIEKSYPIKIYLEDESLEILLFEKDINLKEGMNVSIYGTENINKQIVVTKIICNNC